MNPRGLRIFNMALKYLLSVITENTILSFETLKGKSKMIFSAMKSLKGRISGKSSIFCLYFTLTKQVYVSSFSLNTSTMVSSLGIFKSLRAAPSFIFMSTMAILILFSKSSRNSAFPSICSRLSKNPSGSNFAINFGFTPMIAFRIRQSVNNTI